MKNSKSEIKTQATKIKKPKLTEKQVSNWENDGGDICSPMSAETALQRAKARQAGLAVPKQR